ncbi:RNA-binding protein [Acidisoma cellulosilyticum]|uniref:RNA-binding protein n=1 Tax=Acidisoma cellulosilyticum TaxID=2802395 RepID=UPI0038739EFB
MRRTAALSPTHNEYPDRLTAPAAALTPPLAGTALSVPVPAAEDDDADMMEEHGPLRRCIVTRERQSPSVMIRFVLGPDRAIVPDLSAKLPGRGMWLSARRDVLDTALARKAFARVARTEVLVPVELPSIIEAALKRRVIEILGMTRRAGQAVSGFTKAREWLVADRAAVVVQASDGSPDERARLLNGRVVPVVTPLPAVALGQIFGRDQAVHIAVSAGRLATMLLTESERLAGMSRTRADADQPGG